MADIKSIEAIVQRLTGSTSLPYLDTIDLQPQVKASKLINAKIRIGRRHDQLVFSYYTKHPLRNLEYFQEVRDGAGYIIYTHVPADQVPTQVSLIEPFNIIVSNAGLSLAIKHLAAYIKACFVMKGFTKDEPLILTGHFERSLEAAIRALRTREQRQKAIHINSSSDETIGVQQLQDGDSPSPSGPTKLYDLGKNPGLQTTPSPSKRNDLGMFRTLPVPSVSDEDDSDTSEDSLSVKDKIRPVMSKTEGLKRKDTARSQSQNATDLNRSKRRRTVVDLSDDEHDSVDGMQAVKPPKQALQTTNRPRGMIGTYPSADSSALTTTPTHLEKQSIVQSYEVTKDQGNEITRDNAQPETGGGSATKVEPITENGETNNDGHEAADSTLRIRLIDDWLSLSSKQKECNKKIKDIQQHSQEMDKKVRQLHQRMVELQNEIDEVTKATNDGKRLVDDILAEKVAREKEMRDLKSGMTGDEGFELALRWFKMSQN